MPDTTFTHLFRHADQGVITLAIQLGELHGDGRTDALVAEMTRAIEGEKSPRIVLDFSRVNVLTSMGITALLRFRRIVAERGGYLVLAAVTPYVAEVIGVTKLASPSASGVIPFPIAKDAETASALLRDL